MKKRFATLLLTFAFLFLASLLYAQNLPREMNSLDIQISEIEFRNQQVRDVLFSLARLGNFSLIADETVNGVTSHFFADIPLYEALQIVSRANGIYLDVVDGIWYASKIRISPIDEGETFVAFAQDVPVQSFVDSLSQKAGITILYDELPLETISLQIEGATVSRILEILLSRFSDYELIENEDFFYIHYAPEGETQDDVAQGPNTGIQKNQDGLYQIATRGIRFSQAIDSMYKLEGREYILVKQSDQIIGPLELGAKSFDELLSIILELGEADVIQRGGLSLIVERSRSDILNSYNSTMQLRLQHIQAEALPNLFPTTLLGDVEYKIESTTNSVILTGRESELVSVLEFIGQLDQPMNDLGYFRFDLLNINTEDIASVLPENLLTSEPILIPDQNAFILACTSQKADDIREFLTLFDSRPVGVPIRLKYIQSENLLENLPPSVTSDNILATADPTLVFFSGGPMVYQQFLNELSEIDRPIPQIRYQLLVIQYQNSVRETYELNGSNSKTDSDSDSDSSFIGFVGNLLQLDFDIVSNFGYSFAIDLNWDMSESKARILADTTLTGLSGEVVDFQNTNTYRYRDSEIDTDTGELASTGVTREIVSGLFLQVNGWASGDGMVTMEIETTVSKQGSDSSDSSNPPQTSERVINSHIRTQSGEPVIIGGLVNQEEDSSSSKTPLLGQIPGLGAVFRSRDHSVDDTELIIYIIPHIEYPFSELTPTSELLTQLYDLHFN